MHRIICFIILLISNFAIAAEKIKIITTIKPVFSILKNITTNFAELDYLSSGNQSAHDFTLKPSDVAKIKSCDIIVILDRKFDIEIWNIIEKLDLTNKVIELSKTPNLTLYRSREIQIISSINNDHEYSHEGHGHSHNHGEVDFHIWLDIDNAKKMAAFFMNKIVESDNQNYKKYEDNLLDFYNKCDELNYDINTSLTPVRDNGFIVFHDGYQYFEMQYKLKNLGSNYFNSSETVSLKTATMINDFINTNHVTCILTEPYFNNQILNNIKHNKQINIVEIDGEAAGNIKADSNTYFIMMRQIAANIATCLK